MPSEGPVLLKYFHLRDVSSLRPPLCSHTSREYSTLALSMRAWAKWAEGQGKRCLEDTTVDTRWHRLHQAVTQGQMGESSSMPSTARRRS